MADFNVRFDSHGGTFDMSADDGRKFAAEMGKVTEIFVGGKNYTGPYTVTPKADETQVLPTKDALLKEDVMVKKIPFYETSNSAGGGTVYIAADLNE